MNRDVIATRYLLPALLAALAVAGYFTFGTVKTMEFDGDSVTTDRPPPTESLATPSDRSDRMVVGGQISSLAELDAAQRQAGFVRVGMFGNVWPARIVEIFDDRDGIRFVRGDGTPHSYNDFDGYCMRVVRLRQGGAETLAVYRSQIKN